jgi:acyl-CoA synthetase (NDP forming)
MSLKKILDARSVAIVGASRDEKKRGFQAIRALLDARFEGPIYPINPREETILGLRCYKSILDIEESVDLALITTPAETLPAILDQCGRKGVAGAVIVAGGFGELGKEGKKLQDEIVSVAAAHGMRIVGPNTSGMINVHTGLNLVGLNKVPRGDIALITQSGNMALHLITEAQLKSQRGFSYYVGVGNEADIKFHEYLEFFTADPKTRAILMYVEGMRDGRRFLQQAYKTSREKPVILLKSGRSVKGGKTAGSHTGALAGISEVARSAFERAGIITVENSDELFPAAEALSSLPPIHNDRIAILADGGGHATIAADVLTDLGLKIPELKKETRHKLAGLLSPKATLHNPIDVAGSTDEDPGVFADCARILLESEQIGGLLIVGLFGGYGIRFAERLSFIEEDAAHRMGKLVRETGKPIVLHSLYKFAKPHAHDLLRYYGIPVNDSVEVSCKCISVLAKYGHYLGAYHRRTSFVFDWKAKAKKEGEEIIARALAEKRQALLEHEAKRLLGLHGAPVTDDKLATTAEEAAALAGATDGQVALKICSPDILHKSDARGVKLGLEGESEVRTAFDEIIDSARRYKAKADMRGCVVSPMAESGTEVIIGTKIDPQFGPVIMFGIGGIFVEVLKDVVFRVLPLSRSAARKMLREVKSSSVLNGFRGGKAVDHEALADLLMTVSEVIESYPEIREMDLNPVIARHDGITVVDARIILRKNNR